MNEKTFLNMFLENTYAEIKDTWTASANLNYRRKQRIVQADTESQYICGKDVAPFLLWRSTTSIRTPLSHTDRTRRTHPTSSTD